MRTAINPITARMVQIMFGHLLLSLSPDLRYPGQRGLHTSPVARRASVRAIADDAGVAEGDTVFAIAAQLHGALSGRILTRTDFRVPRFATTDLSGQRVQEIAPRGKHLLLRTDRDLTVHSHLGMDGSWRLYEPGERWRGRAFEVRAVLSTEDRIAVGHRLRRLEVIRTSTEPQLLRDLGPDVLGPDWDEAEATRRLTASPDRPAGDVLVDQSVMAGPGNVYRSEVCFLAGVDPRTPVGALPDPGRLVELTRGLMDRNRRGGRRVTTDDPRPGHDLWVYGRAGRPCRRCGTPVRSFPATLAPGTEGSRGLGRRITFVCPHCQPLYAEAILDQY
jgi:endonuclease-8